MKTTFTTHDYSLRDTLFCGQCFRFRERDNGIFEGMMDELFLCLSQQGDEIIIDGDITEDDVPRIVHFLALDDDYSRINEILSEDPVMKRMVDACGRIRIMNQDYWETLASFTISQNNNIPRIAGIIERFCTCFGEERNGNHLFPTAKRIASLEADDLSVLRCGYRAPYLIDAARKTAEGIVKEEEIKTLPLDEARKLLMSINGIGPKVADCTLLFGAHRIDAFPKDVWIKKAMAAYFPDGLPERAVPYAGIAQQYIFHYARTYGLDA